MTAVVDKATTTLFRAPESERDHQSTARRLQRATVGTTGLLLAVTIVGSTLLFWLVHRSLVDDAYITLTYARTFADHGDWGMLPGHEANSATSPLNVLLLGGLSAVVGDPVLALGVLYMLTCVALVIGLRGLGAALGLGPRVAVLGTPLLIASPLLASTIGLETMLVVTAMTYLAWACVRGDATMAGLVSGISLWLRLDTVVVIAVLVLATPSLLRRVVHVAALAAAIVGPWLAFSWVTLGSAIPDTLLIKQGDAWGTFSDGLTERYYEPYTWAIGGLFVIGGVGLASVLTWYWWRRRNPIDPPVVPALAVAGAAYFGLMWALDVSPFFWYYAPTLAALILAAVIGLATLSTQRFGPAIRAGAVAVGGVALILTVIPWWTGATNQAPLREMPIHGNWAHPGEYAEIGRELGELVGDTPVHSPGEVGSLAYFCECTIVDRFSDRAMLAKSIREAREDSWLYRLNYLGLDTTQLDRIRPGYWLDWRPGPDPTDRGWNTTGIIGGSREHGHIALLTEPPHKPGGRRDDGPRRDGPRHHSDQARGR